MDQIVVPLEDRDLVEGHALQELAVLLVGRDPVDPTELASSPEVGELTQLEEGGHRLGGSRNTEEAVGVQRRDVLLLLATALGQHRLYVGHHVHGALLEHLGLHQDGPSDVVVTSVGEDLLLVVDHREQDLPVLGHASELLCSSTHGGTKETVGVEAKLLHQLAGSVLGRCIALGPSQVPHLVNLLGHELQHFVGVVRQRGRCNPLERRYALPPVHADGQARPVRDLSLFDAALGVDELDRVRAQVRVLYD